MVISFSFLACFSPANCVPLRSCWSGVIVTRLVRFDSVCLILAQIVDLWLERQEAAPASSDVALLLQVLPPHR